MNTFNSVCSTIHQTYVNSISNLTLLLVTDDYRKFNRSKTRLPSYHQVFLFSIQDCFWEQQWHLGIHLDIFPLAVTCQLLRHFAHSCFYLPKTYQACDHVSILTPIVILAWTSFISIIPHLNHFQIATIAIFNMSVKPCCLYFTKVHCRLDPSCLHDFPNFLSSLSPYSLLFECSRHSPATNSTVLSIILRFTMRSDPTYIVIV